MYYSNLNNLITPRLPLMNTLVGYFTGAPVWRVSFTKTSSCELVLVGHYFKCAEANLQ